MSQTPETLTEMVAALVESFADRGKVIVTAESCTGGMIAAGLIAARRSRSRTTAGATEHIHDRADDQEPSPGPSRWR